MAKKLNVPDELQRSFQRLLYSIPDEMRNDALTQKIILVYLKFGGEKLARHGVEILKMRHREEILKKTSEDPNSDEAQSNESNSTDDDSLEFPT
jgi:hypothetical protein